MNEIKFRAYLNKENKMVEVKSLHLGTNRIMYGYSENSQCYGNKSISLKDCELMQYTGLKDKNGKEIYEGDVLVHEFEDYRTKQPRKSYYLVKFKDASFYIAFQETNDYGVYEWVYDDTLEEYYIRNWGLEVVGNIYENLELLEVC